MLTKKRRLKLMSLAIICFLLIGMYIPINSIPASAATGDISNVVSIINSTFEDDDSTIWAVNGGGAATLTRTTTEAQAGIKSLAVTKRTLAYQGPRVNVLGKIAAGTTYTTSVWVKFSGTGTKEFKVTLNSTTDSYKNMIDTFVPANTWTQITGTYTTSTSATPITSAVVYMQCMDATLDYYMDNFSITTNAPSTGGSGSAGTVDSGSSGSGTNGTSGSGTSTTSSAVIINSTFEADDTTVWGKNGSPIITRITTEAQAGISSLAVTGRTATYMGPQTDLTGKIQGGKTYQTSFWVKFNGTGTKTFNVILYGTIDGAAVYKTMATKSVPANTWTQVTGTYTCPSGTVTMAKPYVECSDATADYYIDNFNIINGEISSGSNGTSGSGSTGTSGSGTSDSGSSGTIGTGTSTTSSAVIINSTFEADDTTVWGKNGNPTITRTTTEAQAGISSLAVTGRTATYMGPQADLTGKIQGGKTYQTSFWVKFNGTGTKTFNVILYGTIDGTKVYKTMATKSVQANTWTQVTGTYTCPSGTATLAKPYVECSDAIADFYIDNFSITNGTGSSGTGGTSGSGSTGTSGSGSSGSGTGSTGGSGSGGSGSSSTGKTVKLIESDSTDSYNNVTNNTDKSENTQVVQKGWKLNGYNKWTFIDNESRVTGWNLINSKWYVFDLYGQMKTGWYKEAINGKWYFLNNNGEMKTGWMRDADGKWYFLNNSGDMKTGWMQDTNGKWYFLNISGEMVYNTSVDGYTLGFDGAWIQ